MTDTPNTPPFKVGDRVRTEFYPNEKEIIRRVTSVVDHPPCQSGWLVNVDGGAACPYCGRGPGTPGVGYYAEGVDSRWFTRVDEEE